MSKPLAPTCCSSRLTRRRWLVGVLSSAGGAWLSLSAEAARASAAEFVIIVNQKNPAASATTEFLSDAFLKKAVQWQHGVSIRPADQRIDAPVRRAFSTTVLKRTVAAVRNYWQQRIFSGREVPPPEFESDAAVIRFVQKHEGGVGYVSPNAPLGDVKVLPRR